MVAGRNTGMRPLPQGNVASAQVIFSSVWLGTNTQKRTKTDYDITEF